MFKQKYELSHLNKAYGANAVHSTPIKRLKSAILIKKKKNKTPNYHLCHIHVDVICDIIFRQKKNTPQLLVESNEILFWNENYTGHFKKKSADLINNLKITIPTRRERWYVENIRQDCHYGWFYVGFVFENVH